MEKELEKKEFEEVEIEIFYFDNKDTNMNSFTTSDPYEGERV